MTVEAHAKVNFTLDVCGTRPDGYHALRSVVMPISLADTIEIEATTDGSITSDTGYDDDLCVKAARVLRNCSNDRLTDCTSAGARIHVVKRIPAGGGLGGGSADAAAVLRALNEMWGLHLSRTELAEIGAQVGSDVPALVLGGPVLMEGRGERVSRIGSSIEQSNNPNNRTINLVLSNPGIHSSTKEVYAACEARAKDEPGATDAMVDALKSGDLARIAAAAANDLQTPAVKLHPEIADALTSLRTAGATGVTMTGSGSCVFGFVPDAATAERLSAELNFRGLQSWPVHTI